MRDKKKTKIFYFINNFKKQSIFKNLNQTEHYVKAYYNTTCI